MKLNLALLASASLVLASACAHEPTTSTTASPPAVAQEVPPPPAPASVAQLAGPKGSKVKGVLTFKSEGKGIHVTGDISGLKKNSEHGIHVHEKGECKGPKFESAGGHWNPQKTEHGGPDSQMRHPGDLGNVKADSKGVAHVDVTIPTGTDVGTFGGHSVVLHAKTDDLKTQPSGDSGDRIACGLITQQGQ